MIESLRAIVQGVSNARDLNNAMEFLVVKVKQAMNVGVCSVYLDDAKRERYLLMASDGLNRASVGRSYLEYGQGLIGWVAVWLVGQLIGWLAGWLAGWMPGGIFGTNLGCHRGSGCSPPPAFPENLNRDIADCGGNLASKS